MLLGGLALTLAGEHLQRGGDHLTGRGRLDHIVDIAFDGGIHAVSDFSSILRFQLGADSGGIGGVVQLLLVVPL